MKKLSIVLIIILLIIATIAAIGLSWYNSNIENKSNNSDTVSITVEAGDNLLSIGKILEEKNVIGSELALKIYLRLNNIESTIKVGNYNIPQNLPLSEVIDILEKGSLKESVWVTLRPSLRPEQAATYITEAFKNSDAATFTAEEYINIAENPQNYTFATDVQDFLNKYKPSNAGLIGFLYPDTYNLDSDASALTVINTQIKTLIARLQENGINPSNAADAGEFENFFDALTLASILDKESGGSDDRQIISSIFHNRLRDGIPLQSDATINFFTKRNDPRPTFAELAIDNPYNSYMYAGLPPGPINSPEIKSIFASVNPKDTNYYFFRHDVNANIYYSETFQQHQESIYLYP